MKNSNQIKINYFLDILTLFRFTNTSSIKILCNCFEEMLAFFDLLKNQKV